MGNGSTIMAEVDALTRRARTKPVLFTDTEKSLFKQIAALYEA